MRKSATQIEEEHLSCSFSTKLLKRLLHYGCSKHDRLRLEIRKSLFPKRTAQWWSWGSGRPREGPGRSLSQERQSAQLQMDILRQPVQQGYLIVWPKYFYQVMLLGRCGGNSFQTPRALTETAQSSGLLFKQTLTSFIHFNILLTVAFLTE